jgi:hypothetical protein
MQDPVRVASEEDGFKAILSDGKAKQITMDFARDVDAPKIKDAYIPWAIAIVIASVATIAMMWIRNGSNRLAKIAEGRKGAMGRPPTGAGGDRR